MQDWIKMRTDIYRDPKVCLMADHLMNPESLLNKFVNQNMQCDMVVTRNVTRCATVGATLATWGVMRHRGKRRGDDLFCAGATLWTIDDISDIPGFGAAMESVGWVIDDPEGLIFPNFFAEYNVEVDTKGKGTAAERQKRYRERQKKKSNGERDVTRDVTSDGREEERREESLYISGAKLAKTEPLNITEQKASNQHLTTLLESGRTAGAEIEQREDVQKYAAEWIRHLEEKAVDKVPYVGTAHHGEFWALLHEIGPDRFIAAIRYTIRNGWLNIREEVKERKARGSKSAQPDTDPDFLRAVAVCKEFPSGSDFDREKREAALGPLIRIVRKMTSARLAECDKFTQKQLAAEWTIVREGMK